MVGARTFELLQTSDATIIYRMDMLLYNEAAEGAYSVFRMPRKPGGEVMSLTLLALLHSRMTRYLEDMVRNKIGVHDVGQKTMMLGNKALKLLPVAM